MQSQSVKSNCNYNFFNYEVFEGLREYFLVSKVKVSKLEAIIPGRDVLNLRDEPWRFICFAADLPFVAFSWCILYVRRTISSLFLCNLKHIHLCFIQNSMKITSQKSIPLSASHILKKWYPVFWTVRWIPT